MFKKIVVLGLFFSYCTAPFAAAINAQLGNDAARFMYTGGAISTRLQYEAGAIYSNSDLLGVVGLSVSGENMDAPVVATLGLRGYFGNVTTDSSTTKTVSAIALGGDVAFSPLSLPGFEFGAHYYISPSPVSFGDIDKFVDYGVRVGYQVIPLTTLFIGYQSLTTEIRGFGKFVLDEGIVFGMNFTF